MGVDSMEIFQKLKEDITAYVEIKFELLKLNTYERTAKVVAILSYAIILLFLTFFATLFLFLALGLFIGSMIGSISAGIGIVFLIYAIVILIIYLLRNKLMCFIQNVIIGALNSNDDNENDTAGKEKDIDTTGATQG